MSLNFLSLSPLLLNHPLPHHLFFPNLIWLSNQLFLHSTNNSSILGPHPVSSTISSISSPTHVSPSNASQSYPPITSSQPNPPDPCPQSSTLTSHLSEVATDALPPSITAPTSILTLQPVPSVQTNQHSMQTRSKSGISKPISKLCYKAVIDYTFTEPPTYKITSTYPKWCEAMDAEFQALQR